MDPEDVIKLFDAYWFHYEILKKKQYFSFSSYSKINASSSSEPRFSSLRSILGRSQSEDMASIDYGSFSPSSVLQSIPSCKLPFTKQEQEAEAEAEDEAEAKKDQKEESNLQEKKNWKRRIGMSKSLSDLEFEELKGFMDLGFVFSEKDKDSSLVEIIPGLQRLGDERESESNLYSSTAARRPYLSEAWGDLNRKLKKRENVSPLMMKWEVPSLSDEIDMKDNLKLWAHTVATLVR